MPFTPRQAATDALARARALATEAQTVSSHVLRDDLRRLAIVMAVAALDAYLHRRVYESTTAGKDLPADLSKVRASFLDIADFANASLEARQKNPPVKDRPWVRVRNLLNDRLLKITFQSSQEVADALAMVGITHGWQKIADEVGVGVTSKFLQDELDAIVHRRNQIVHEGDFKQLYRPRTLRRNRVSQDDADHASNMVEILIVAMDKIV